MSANEKAGNMEARQDTSFEAERKQEATESMTDEARVKNDEARISEEHQDTNEVRVTDKRRFSAEGELVAADEDPPEKEAETEASGSIEQWQEKLRASESQRVEAERQVKDYAERFRHAQNQIRAENDELRARWQRNFEQKLEAGRGDLVGSLLDVLDNLKRAVAAAEASGEKGPGFEALLEGVRATAELFEQRMRNLGLASVPSTGEEFNPEIHEAVEMVPVEADQDNRVVAELQPGYKFGDRLLRPARVRVGRSNG